jgi:UDP-glucose 6-dehydrogenase
MIQHDDNLARAGPDVDRTETPADREGPTTDLASAEVVPSLAGFARLAHMALMNELADLCEPAGADVEHVREWLKRCGWLWVPPVSAFVAGRSFPDEAMSWTDQLAAAMVPHAVSEAIVTAHRARRPLLVRRVREALGTRLGESTLAVWGLSLQANIDDCRSSSALHLIDVLAAEHRAIRFRVFDPQAHGRACDHFARCDRIYYAADPYDAADAADLLVIATGWELFQKADLARVAGLLHQPIIVDGRNLFAPAAMRAYGFEYRSLGRPIVERGIPLRAGRTTSEAIARRALSAFTLLIRAFLAEAKAFCEQMGAHFPSVLRATAMDPRLRHLAGPLALTDAMRQDAVWLYELGRTHKVPLHILPALLWKAADKAS